MDMNNGTTMIMKKKSTKKHKHGRKRKRKAKIHTPPTQWRCEQACGELDVAQFQAACLGLSI